MNSTLLSISPRREAMSYEECIEYLEQEHVPLVERLPGLKRFTTSRPLAPDDEGYPFDPTGTRYDVLARLEFESLEALDTAFESDAGRRVLRDTENFLAVDETVTVVVVDETLRYQSIPTVL